LGLKTNAIKENNHQKRMGMVIEMGMIMTKDAYGAPPDLAENMFS
jgi:hypothetical protein